VLGVGFLQPLTCGSGQAHHSSGALSALMPLLLCYAAPVWELSIDVLVDIILTAIGSSISILIFLFAC
jgi:hypothetical protein